MKPIVKVGIIGLGAISGAHIPNYVKSERAGIEALCDIDGPWLKKEGERLGVTACYTDYRDLISDRNVDAVIVCTPNYLHSQVTVDALNAGKHVLCEKPMARTAAEAIAMKQAAEKSGKKLMISHNQRFGADIQLLADKNLAGAFGDIYFMRLAWRRPLGCMPSPSDNRPDGTPYNRNWFNEKAKGGGVLRDLGSHLLDLAMFIAGFPELESASASCYRKFYPELPESELGKYPFDSEDLASGHIKFKNGLSFELEVSFGSMIEKERLLTEIYGTKMGASRGSDGVRFYHEAGGVLSTETVTRFAKQTMLPDELFLDCILNDTASPVTPEQGFKVIEILDALYASGMKNGCCI